MHRLSLVLAVLPLATPIPAASPIAEVICEPTPRLERKLTAQFGSRRQAMGLRSPDEVMEIWTDSTGGWTLVVTYATGQSCIVAMGAEWQVLSSDPA